MHFRRIGQNITIEELSLCFPSCKKILVHLFTSSTQESAVEINSCINLTWNLLAWVELEGDIDSAL
jgi:hypothetical protein